MASLMADNTRSSEPSSRFLSASRPADGGVDDDLFNYDFDEDVFADEIPGKISAKLPEASKHDDTGLGIDEEVKITRKPRAPRAKLDEKRLLSQAGIPMLRKRAKNLKLKGKGHEYSDAARLLQFYQLWLDDLFPKAKFLDAFTMVEKLGHKRTMQMQRNKWIDEGKPTAAPDHAIFDLHTFPDRLAGQTNQPVEEKAGNVDTNHSIRPTSPTQDEVRANEDDIYEASPHASSRKISNPVGHEDTHLGLAGNIVPAGQSFIEDDLDALDALLAEQNSNTRPLASSINTSFGVPGPDSNFDEDMEAMAELTDIW